MSIAEKLHDRAYLLGKAAEMYFSLSISAKEFLTVLGGLEFGAAIDPGLPARLDETLTQQVRPALVAAWAAYLTQFGFSIGDCVRVWTRGMPAVEFAPFQLTFYCPFRKEPFAWAVGNALKKNGSPGKRIVVAKLYPGTTTVTVL
jgi:hypothetical protein